MLEYTIMKPEGIVVLKPNATLSKEDFAGLSASVDAHLADHASIHGLLMNVAAPSCLATRMSAFRTGLLPHRVGCRSPIKRRPRPPWATP
jgi:hypothetical protein